MPDHPRVSEVLSLSSFTSFLPPFKPPVRLARALVITTAWVSEKTPAEKVTRMFGQDPRLPGLAILHKSEPRQICQPQHDEGVLPRRSKRTKIG
jgi:hypothetical protein